MEEVKWGEAHVQGGINPCCIFLLPAKKNETRIQTTMIIVKNINVEIIIIFWKLEYKEDKKNNKRRLSFQKFILSQIFW